MGGLNCGIGRNFTRRHLSIRQSSAKALVRDLPSVTAAVVLCFSFVRRRVVPLEEIKLGDVAVLKSGAGDNCTHGQAIDDVLHPD